MTNDTRTSKELIDAVNGFLRTSHGVYGPEINRLARAVDRAEKATLEPLRVQFGPPSENRRVYTSDPGTDALRHALTALPERSAQPPGLEVPILRNCLGNLYVAVENLGRDPSVPRDPDVQFAMREAAQALGPPYSTSTKPGEQA